MCLRQQGESRPFLAHAAMNGFWDAGPPTLKRLLLHLDVPFVDGESEYELVCKSVRKVLPGISEEDLSNALSHRKRMPLDEIPKCVREAEEEELFEKDDLAELQEACVRADR